VHTAHNTWRARYGAQDLIWDENLAVKAADWAKQCQWEHNSEGQNLDSAGSSDGNPTLNGDLVLEHWVNGPNEADIWSPTNPIATHFTQVVWKGTTHVGCAIVDCDLSVYDASWWPAKYAVCNYYPPGNVVGDFAANVGVRRF